MLLVLPLSLAYAVRVVETLCICPRCPAISEDCAPAIEAFDSRPLEEARCDDRDRQQQRESHVAERYQSECQGVGGVVAVPLLADVVGRICAVDQHADGQIPNLEVFIFLRNSL